MVQNKSSRAVGVGRVLIVVYGILALAAAARSFVQIVERFDEAPLAYTLSAVSAVVYIVATVALTRPGRGWYFAAWITICFELLGVLIVGTLSLMHPDLFAHASVWSFYGSGYLFVPLVIPVLGIAWLYARRPSLQTAGNAAAPRA
ncbi:MAG: hypothetical protein JWP30_1235 [Homoserinimonas sp.]|jgi:hypothetical protein|nr:hypothetical protein [Homoserinimonas sp.]